MLHCPYSFSVLCSEHWGSLPNCWYPVSFPLSLISSSLLLSSLSYFSPSLDHLSCSLSHLFPSILSLSLSLSLSTTHAIQQSLSLCVHLFLCSYLHISFSLFLSPERSEGLSCLCCSLHGSVFVFPSLPPPSTHIPLCFSPLCIFFLFLSIISTLFICLYFSTSNLSPSLLVCLLASHPLALLLLPSFSLYLSLSLHFSF